MRSEIGKRCRIVPASAVGDLGRLESLALRIFGLRDRPAGWFARKLKRECVDPALSRLAIAGDADPRRPSSWLGYVLVGVPPSLAPAVRTAGTGVVPDARGAGVGRRLVAEVRRGVAVRGFRRVLLPADQGAVRFYERCGFRRRRRLETLVSFGRGPFEPRRLPAAERWTPPEADQWHEHCAWLEEAWDRTEHRLRTTLRAAYLVLHASREGRALVIHRVLGGPGIGPGLVADGLDRILDESPEGKPILIAAADPARSLPALLKARGWAVAQSGVELECEVWP